MLFKLEPKLSKTEQKKAEFQNKFVLGLEAVLFPEHYLEHDGQFHITNSISDDKIKAQLFGKDYKSSPMKIEKIASLLNSHQIGEKIYVENKKLELAEATSWICLENQDYEAVGINFYHHNENQLIEEFEKLLFRGYLDFIQTYKTQCSKTSFQIIKKHIKNYNSK